MKLEEIIPEGIYCYEMIDKELDSQGRMRIKLCPFFTHYKNDISLCLLEKVYSFNSDQPTNLDIEVLEKSGFVWDTILWDQCKCCGVNDFWIDDGSEVEDIISCSHENGHCGKCSC